MSRNKHRDIIRMLDIFDSLPQELVAQFIGDNLELSLPEQTIGYLKHNRYIHQDKQGWISLYPNTPHNTKGACACALYMELMTDDMVTLRYGDFPFDYLFVAEHQLYCIVDISEDGIAKLNMLNKMRDEEKKFCNIILLLINRTLDRFPEECIPKIPFITAEVEYKRGVKDIQIKAHNK